MHINRQNLQLREQFTKKHTYWKDSILVVHQKHDHKTQNSAKQSWKVQKIKN